METFKNMQAVSARSRKDWRRWLEKNHLSEKSVWLIIYHKTSETKSVYYEDAVEEAICFGWIDSVANKRDAESRYQLFSRRKPASNWSKLNRQRAEKMIAENAMAPAGLAIVELARKNGHWEALTDVQNSVIPSDLEELLAKNKKASEYFMAFPPSSKRIILEWILNARTPATRLKRIKQTVELAQKNLRANHYRQ